MLRCVFPVLLLAVAVGPAAPVPKDFGAQLLIVSKTGETSRLVLMNADGTNAKELTDGRSNASYPAWSPDGRRIAFCSDRVGGVMQVFTMAADGTDVKQLTKGRQPCRVPAWSPDGKRIAFCTPPPRGGSEIRLVDADGGNPTALDGDAWDPAFSPDGKALAFVTYREGSGFKLYRMDADGKNVTKLVDNPNPIGLAYPAWSPDGTRIAFADLVEGHLELHLVDADGKNARRVTAFGGYTVYPAWSPDGKRIAALQYKDATRAELVVMDPDGKNPKTLLKDVGAAEGGRPVWRPKR